MFFIFFLTSLFASQLFCGEQAWINKGPDWSSIEKVGPVSKVGDECYLDLEEASRVLKNNQNTSLEQSADVIPAAEEIPFPVELVPSLLIDEAAPLEENSLAEDVADEEDFYENSDVVDDVHPVDHSDSVLEDHKKFDNKMELQSLALKVVPAAAFIGAGALIAKKYRESEALFSPSGLKSPTKRNVEVSNEELKNEELNRAEEEHSLSYINKIFDAIAQEEDARQVEINEESRALQQIELQSEIEFNELSGRSATEVEAQREIAVIKNQERLTVQQLSLINNENISRSSLEEESASSFAALQQEELFDNQDCELRSVCNNQADEFSKINDEFSEPLLQHDCAKRLLFETEDEVSQEPGLRNDISIEENTLRAAAACSLAADGESVNREKIVKDEFSARIDLNIDRMIDLIDKESAAQRDFILNLEAGEIVKLEEQEARERAVVRESVEFEELVDRQEVLRDELDGRSSIVEEEDIQRHQIALSQELDSFGIDLVELDRSVISKLGYHSILDRVLNGQDKSGEEVLFLNYTLLVVKELFKLRALYKTALDYFVANALALDFSYGVCDNRRAVVQHIKKTLVDINNSFALVNEILSSLDSSLGDKRLLDRLTNSLELVNNRQPYVFNDKSFLISPENIKPLLVHCSTSSRKPLALEELPQASFEDCKFQNEDIFNLATGLPEVLLNKGQCIKQIKSYCQQDGCLLSLRSKSFERFLNHCGCSSLSVEGRIKYIAPRLLNNSNPILLSDDELKDLKVSLLRSYNNKFVLEQLRGDEALHYIYLQLQSLRENQKAVLYGSVLERLQSEFRRQICVLINISIVSRVLWNEAKDEFVCLNNLVAYFEKLAFLVAIYVDELNPLRKTYDSLTKIAESSFKQKVVAYQEKSRSGFNKLKNAFSKKPSTVDANSCNDLLAFATAAKNSLLSDCDRTLIYVNALFDEVQEKLHSLSTVFLGGRPDASSLNYLVDTVGHAEFLKNLAQANHENRAFPWLARVVDPEASLQDFLKGFCDNFAYDESFKDIVIKVGSESTNVIYEDLLNPETQNISSLPPLGSDHSKLVKQDPLSLQVESLKRDEYLEVLIRDVTLRFACKLALPQEDLDEINCLARDVKAGVKASLNEDVSPLALSSVEVFNFEENLSEVNKTNVSVPAALSLLERSFVLFKEAQEVNYESDFEKLFFIGIRAAIYCTNYSLLKKQLYAKQDLPQSAADCVVDVANYMQRLLKANEKLEHAVSESKDIFSSSLKEASSKMGDLKNYSQSEWREGSRTGDIIRQMHVRKSANISFLKDFETSLVRSFVQVLKDSLSKSEADRFTKPFQEKFLNFLNELNPSFSQGNEWAGAGVVAFSREGYQLINSVVKSCIIAVDHMYTDSALMEKVFTPLNGNTPRGNRFDLYNLPPNLFVLAQDELVKYNKTLSQKDAEPSDQSSPRFAFEPRTALSPMGTPTKNNPVLSPVKSPVRPCPRSPAKGRH